jgi:threonine aldolase
MFCLSKGLGAPVGSLFCGARELVAAARQVRKLFGGGMRQAGVLAAAGLVALRKGPARLAEDHANAARLAQALADLPGFDLDPASVRTNIVIVRLTPELRGAGDFGGEGGDPAGALLDHLRMHGVLANPVTRDSVRFVTHRDVSRAQVETAIARIRGALAAGLSRLLPTGAPPSSAGAGSR